MSDGILLLHSNHSDLVRIKTGSVLSTKYGFCRQNSGISSTLLHSGCFKNFGVIHNSVKHFVKGICTAYLIVLKLFVSTKIKTLKLLVNIIISRFFYFIIYPYLYKHIKMLSANCQSYSAVFDMITLNINLIYEIFLSKDKFLIVFCRV